MKGGGWFFVLVGALLGALIPINGKNLFQELARPTTPVAAPCVGGGAQ